MKMFILVIILSVLAGIPTMIGVIPTFIGVPAMLLITIIFVAIFAVFSRGPAMEMIRARMFGGLLAMVMRRDKRARLERFEPQGGMIHTGKHGSFNIMSDRIYSLHGLPLAVFPEKVGYNVGIDHAQLVDELKKLGIANIGEVCDLDDYGRFLNFKDDPRIKDLKIKVEPWQAGFDDFYKYTTEAANPIHQDANIKIGIAQGLLGKEMGKLAWLIGAGILVFLVCLGVFVLLQWGGGGSQEPIRIIVENGAGTVIPI